MLKFLTHKLRTHSLNEESVSEKVEERDSGTESDDEADRPDSGDFCTDVIMKWNDVTDINGSGAACACAPAPPAPRLPAPEPDLLYDHHSSEEELEVINGVCARGAEEARSPAPARLESRRRAASSPAPAGAAPEKRRSAAPRVRPPSDDDDDTKVETPVRFRTSPPLEALKPRRAGGSMVTMGAVGSVGSVGGIGSVGAGLSMCACARSEARRRRVALPPRRHRPALDFDKMQQLKVGAAGAGAGAAGAGVRSWRAVGAAHTGELSVFCW